MGDLKRIPKEEEDKICRELREGAVPRGSQTYETYRVFDNAAYAEMQNSVRELQRIITEAMARQEFEDEKCTAVFELKEPKDPFATEFVFLITIPDYGIILTSDEVLQIATVLPYQSTVDISPNYKGDKIRISIVYRGVFQIIQNDND